MQEIPHGYCQCGCGEKTRIAKWNNTPKGWVSGRSLRFVNGHNNSVKRETDIKDRFWSKVAIKGADECWEWKASRYPGGYGKFSIKDRYQQAHRLAWRLSNGEIPSGQNILHKCDNPPCVNPNHLFLGTQTDNMHDMMAKNRHNFNGLLLGTSALRMANDSSRWSKSIH
jgi:hypothetical protein